MIETQYTTLLQLVSRIHKYWQGFKKKEKYRKVRCLLFKTAVKSFKASKFANSSKWLLTKDNYQGLESCSYENY